ncbi:HEAT repeat domain-containing protein [Anatilimnocola floriformis]|uniref:HEAT repeat domain-containing protein n=1 Tax=Anatilimnocola floriformis TaxID=2948575 RepID=UPI0020C4CF95|nr:hypothetical protein [Anatilimnocola floriformis]
MNVSRIMLGAAVALFLGCRPSPPPVAPVNESAQPVPPAQPANTPPPVQPTPTKLPSVDKPKPPTPATTAAPEKNSLRDLAARLIEPTDKAGWRISESAALELERLGPDASKKLLPLLGDPLLEVRRGAAFHLLSSFDPAVPEQVTAFKKLLDDKDATVRNIGFQAVKQLPQAEIAAASPQLATLLDPTHETKAENRAAVARLAGTLGAKGAPFADALQKAATSDSDDRVRAAAIFAYMQVAASPETAVPLLQKALKDSKPSVRLVATGRLRSLATKAEAAAPDLAAALADDSEDVRLAASEALVRIGPPALTPLRTALETGNANAKKLSLACLSALGPAAKEVLPAIEKAQGDADKTISDAAKELVSRLK